MANESSAPSVLIVTAHPDDESVFAATTFAITQQLKGRADLALITNGEGGYKYSLLAERIYKKKLTQEEIGRKYLPQIRKKELKAGGKYIGINNYYFFDQVDHQYTKELTFLDQGIWDKAEIKKRLSRIIVNNNYDYIFVLLPTKETHGHHKAASILALEVVKELEHKPIVLGASVLDQEKKANYSHLEDYEITKTVTKNSSFSFNRNQKFGYKNKLTYQIIVNWLIAEHKSQGTIQNYMNKGDIEHFWFFAINDLESFKETEKLFKLLNSLGANLGETTRL